MAQFTITAYYLLGGGYSMLTDDHVRMDLFYGSLSKKGKAKMDTISVDMLRHYAEDAGDSEDEISRITEPKYVLEFIAEGVLIEQ